MLAALAICAPAQAAGPTAKQATAFLRQIYAGYRKVDYSPLKENGARVFDKAMIALIKEDARLARGEIGAMDFDPICQCQDSSGILATVQEAVLTAPGAATATAILGFSGPGEKATKLRFSLVAEGGQWRIHDISSPADVSLRRYLINANAKAAAEIAAERKTKRR